MARSDSKRIIWEELKSTQVDSVVAGGRVALLPIGSTEQHGSHLPLGTDNYIPARIAEIVSDMTGAPILPLIPYGPCDWHTVFPGSISIPAETFIDFVFHVAKGAAQQGFAHIIAVNGHTGGSNPALLVAADRVVRETQARLWVADVVQVAREEVLSFATTPVLGHADEIETSKVLAIRPDLVDLGQVSPWEKEPASVRLSKNYRRGSAILSRISTEEWAMLAPGGFLGNPLEASPEKGARMLEASAEAIAAFIQDLAEGNVYAPVDVRS
jgi:creatinine amidohydrolase